MVKPEFIPKLHVGITIEVREGHGDTMENNEEVEIRKLFMEFFETLDAEDKKILVEGALEILQEKANREADQSESSQG